MPKRCSGCCGGGGTRRSRPAAPSRAWRSPWAGRDGFWLARWLRAHGVGAYIIHSTSVAVSREHRRAKTDRLDTELLKRAFLGWLRGEPDHCSMVAIPTIEAEDAKRPNRERESLIGERVTLPPNTLAELRRDMARLRFVSGQITEIEQARLERLRQAPDERPHAMVRLLAWFPGGLAMTIRGGGDPGLPMALMPR